MLSIFGRFGFGILVGVCVKIGKLIWGVIILVLILIFSIVDDDEFFMCKFGFVKVLIVIDEEFLIRRLGIGIVMFLFLVDEYLLLLDGKYECDYEKGSGDERDFLDEVVFVFFMLGGVVDKEIGEIIFEVLLDLLFGFLFCLSILVGVLLVLWIVFIMLLNCILLWGFLL